MCIVLASSNSNEHERQPRVSIDGKEHKTAPRTSGAGVAGAGAPVDRNCLLTTRAVSPLILHPQQQLKLLATESLSL